MISGVYVAAVPLELTCVPPILLFVELLYHWYVKPVPEAVTVKLLADPPKQTLKPEGWALIVGNGLL